MTIQSNFPLLTQLSKVINKRLTFIDLETTALLNKDNFGIIEIAIIHIDGRDSANPLKSVVRKQSLIDPQMELNYECTRITGITQSMVNGQALFSTFAPYIYKCTDADVIIGYNSKTFDVPALVQEMDRCGFTTTKDNIAQIDVRDVYLIDKKLRGIDGSKGTLVVCAEEHGISIEGDAHRAAYDIEITALSFEKILGDRGLQWGVDVYNKKVTKQDPTGSGIEKPAYNRWGGGGDTPESEIIESIKKECLRLEEEALGNMFDIVGCASHLGCKESNVSFAIGKMLDKEAGRWDKHFTHAPTQAWLEVHINTAMAKVWVGNEHGKLKPLMVYFSALSDAGQYQLDYTQIRLVIKKAPNKKPGFGN